MECCSLERLLQQHIKSKNIILNLLDFHFLSVFMFLMNSRKLYKHAHAIYMTMSCDIKHTKSATQATENINPNENDINWHNQVCIVFSSLIQ